MDCADGRCAGGAQLAPGGLSDPADPCFLLVKMYLLYNELIVRLVGKALPGSGIVAGVLAGALGRVWTRCSCDVCFISSTAENPGVACVARGSQDSVSDKSVEFLRAYKYASMVFVVVIKLGGGR